MKKFITSIIKFSSIAVVPLILLIIGYIKLDPFRVIYNYSNYSYPYVTPNRDFISTEMFIKNKNIYNSFIFGSSRTLAFRPSTWKQYLSVYDKPFMFDASAESIYGIYTKLLYLDSQKNRISNVLIIICRDYSFENHKNHKGHLYIKHPLTSNENKIVFHYNFIRAYLSPHFLLSFYDFELTKQYKDWMEGFIVNKRTSYDTITNEMKLLDQQQEIEKNPTDYYLKRKEMFYERQAEKTDSVARIKEEHLFMLKEIKRILVKNKTNYKVIISPLYEQTKLNKHDINILTSIFGLNLYDYSGKNNFTENKLNYYETSHYIPSVGDSILQMIYK